MQFCQVFVHYSISTSLTITYVSSIGITLQLNEGKLIDIRTNLVIHSMIQELSKWRMLKSQNTHLFVTCMLSKHSVEMETLQTGSSRDGIKFSSQPCLPELLSCCWFVIKATIENHYLHRDYGIEIKVAGCGIRKAIPRFLQNVLGTIL